jgi:NAD(P)-dependent dehydrogenase (short-subunit alcohol dehydrogenase family)
MLGHGAGSIVNIASISATIANRGLQQAHYNATKAGVVQLSRSLALEWAQRGVRVNALSPGYVRTNIARGATFGRTLDQYLDDIPLGRMADVDDMVGPAVFLLSEAAAYCTGTELVVDGGATSW